MARLNVVTPAQASGQTRELYGATQRAIGMVPNIYQGLGNSAVALEGVLHTDGILKKGQLSGAEIEAVKLAVSEAYGCEYCLAAHTLLGKKAGLSAEETLNIRRGTAQQPKIRTLVKFVNAALHPQARISDADLGAVKAAGYNDAQITEIVQVISQTVFTTLFNRRTTRRSISLRRPACKATLGIPSILQGDRECRAKSPQEGEDNDSFLSRQAPRRTSSAGLSRTIPPCGGATSASSGWCSPAGRQAPASSRSSQQA